MHFSIRIIGVLEYWFFLNCLIIVSFLTSCESNIKDKDSSSQIDSLSTYKVIAIVDGDTYDILVDNSKAVRVRMEGIDAPERGMPFYKASKKHLSELCFGRLVKLRPSGLDRYKRILAYTYLDNGTELSAQMIRDGYAWHYAKYNSDSNLARLEVEARGAKAGIWSVDNPMPPWRNRALHNSGVSTVDSFAIVEGQE